jgi:hypothetical protein
MIGALVSTRSPYSFFPKHIWMLSALMSKPSLVRFIATHIANGVHQMADEV